jgi:hypothetical protein
VSEFGEGEGQDDIDGGTQTDVIALPPGELFSETNDNSVAILLTYGTARVLLARPRPGSVRGRRFVHGALSGG